MSSVKWANKERFYAKLRKTLPKVEVGLTDAARKSAGDFVSLAKRLVPVEEGDLQDSIRMHAGPRVSSYTVQAGGAATTKPVRDGADSSYDYALAQEYGTQNMPANPFFWPSFRVTRKLFRGRAGRALRKAFKEAGF